MAKHAERDHAIVSASGAHRWMACTPSARLEEQFPNYETEYSKEGTRAHEFAEQCLRKEYETDFAGAMETLMVSELGSELYDGVLPYLDYIAETYRAAKKKDADTVLFLEQKLDLAFMIPEGFGAVDAVIIHGDTLEIIDLKYGKGVRVEAQSNEQLRCYAAGAYKLFEDLYEDIENITMTIIQPRLDHISTETITVEDLLKWIEVEVAPKADMAFKGTGDLQPGSHCRFCKAGAVCRARTEKNLELAKKDFISPDLLSIEEFAEIISRSEQIAKWADSVSAYALEIAKRGEHIPGYKLVEGRSVRVYKSDDKIVDELKKHDYQSALLYEPRKVLGVTKMEKLLGKKLFKTYLEDTGLVVKPQGKPTLAPESDKRKAMPSSALEDFKNEDPA